MKADISDEWRAFILNTRESVCEKLGVSGHRLICDCFCDVLGTDIEEIKQRSRMPDIVLKRHIICWAVKNLSPMSFTQTGFILERDHSTIIFASKRVFNLLSNKSWGDDYVKTVVTEAITKIRSELKINEVEYVSKEEYLKALDVIHRYQAQQKLTT